MTKAAEIIAEYLSQFSMDGPDAATGGAVELIHTLDAAGFIVIPKQETETQIRAGKIAAEHLVDGSADQGGPRVWSLESSQLSAVYRAMTMAATQPEMTERELRVWLDSLPTNSDRIER